MSRPTRAADLPAECRAFLAAPDATPTSAHARACVACAATMALRHRLGDVLRQPPAPPSALASRAFLASVHERIVDGIEGASSVAPRLAEPVAPPATAATAPLTTDLEQQLGQRVARALTTPPALPSEGQWRDVRRAVIHDIAIRRAARTRVAVWIGLAGAAAAALFLLVGPEAGRSNTPTIVFADLATAPFGDFAVVRRGADR